MQYGVNNLPKVVAQQRRGRASNPRLLDRKSDALPLSHRATPSCSFDQHGLILILLGKLHQHTFRNYTYIVLYFTTFTFAYFSCVLAGTEMTRHQRLEAAPH